MKDFNLAKYLKENYQGPFSMFQPYVDLNPIKEGIKRDQEVKITSGVHAGKTATVHDFNSEKDSASGEDWVDVLIGSKKEKKTVKASELKPLKEESEEQLDTEVPYKGPDPHLDGMGSEYDQVAPVEEAVDGQVKKKFDLSDPESSEDAYEWILDNISDDEDVVKSQEEDDEFRLAPIEDIVDIINDRLKNATIDIDIVDNTVTDELSQEYQEWTKQNNLPEMSADELLYDDSIEKTPEQEKYLKDFIDRWDSTDDYITLTITNTPQIKEAFSAEQEKFDRMMGLIDRTLEAQLPKIKNAVDKARDMMISDKSIFNMLSTSSITKQAVKDLVDDGFDPMDIVDFFATDFTIAEDGDNVTAADNAAYGADQQAGEPFEEEVTVSSSGVEM